MGAYVFGFMLFIGGLAFTWLGYSNLMSTRKKLATWRAVKGTVVDLAERGRDEDDRTLYAPVYRYVVDGTPHTGTSTIVSAPAGYRIGDPIDVLVDPVKPNQSQVIDSTAGLATYGLLAMGLLVMGLGVFLAWLAITGRVVLE